MGELAQLPWWRRLKWRWLRRLLQLQQLRARGFGGGAGGLGCAVRTPARGPGCWGGASLVVGTPAWGSPGEARGGEKGRKDEHVEQEPALLFVTLLPRLLVSLAPSGDPPRKSLPALFP
ncbi:hypothetical protein J1605_015462 [Eschrichtius robustus]|uniref:Uncharacterized protein n=1 Tax=Eschrichtius robustus TaxID=9764 RepID=A0AB34GAB6_ESCRO|nr:hypothetical protein J1605_015462 [Eschrichtius robustus]